MRPLRIEMEGFSAFRDRAEIDFSDAELFALVGPTGAGKSSVIDAMVFALYGSVPRYDSENLVHPVITQGAVEARVRLDFRVGEVDYTATRVVRRTRTGATTKEARLECGDDILADEPKGLTAAVGELLGLDLEQFTKCVVLPQGAFATLLHDSKAKRQDLLVKLLDLGVYERIAAAARAEVKRVGFRLESLDEQLTRAEHATDENVAAAEVHARAVDDVVAALDAAAPTLESLDEERRALDTDLRAAEASMTALGTVAVPPGVDEIAGHARAAAAKAEEAEAAETVTAVAVTEAEAARDRLPAAETLRTHQREHAELVELRSKVETGAGLVDELQAETASLLESADAASNRLAEVSAVLDRARIDNAAADIAGNLHDGDDCPVCGNRFAGHQHDGAEALSAAEVARDAAAKDEQRARTLFAEHQTKLADYRARLELRSTERDALAQRLASAPAPEEIERALAEVVAADRRLAAARNADAGARAASRQARVDAEAASRRVADARREFTAARDRLSPLGPPAPGDDLAADWAALVSWASDTGEQLVARAADLRTARDVVAKQRSEQLALLAERARAAGVPVVSDEALRDACLTEAATARARLTQLTAERDQAAELRAERAGLEERRQVHDLLAEHLGARGFEAWLLDEALDALLEGASAWLEQLSSGRYAMAVDGKKQFAVIDHANADERRLARTLSGGETFLASLALALALAERVSELSAIGGTTLDAIFLDEGFGTLDPATLDVVATAIEELGATGRMVGLISHVPELAERVPVRFEITKQPGTSSVQRVET